jgi:hypothetical protein
MVTSDNNHISHRSEEISKLIKILILVHTKLFLYIFIKENLVKGFMEQHKCGQKDQNCYQREQLASPPVAWSCTVYVLADVAVLFLKYKLARRSFP